MEVQFKKARESWNIERSEYENEIHILTDQVELLQTKVDELSVYSDQDKKEYDAKLVVTEGKLLKERQLLEQTFKELNHVTEYLQYSRNELAEANANHEDLKLKILVISADKSSIQDELKQLQEEMHVKKSQHESERNAAEKKFNEQCGYTDQLQQTVGQGINESKRLVILELKVHNMFSYILCI